MVPKRGCAVLFFRRNPKSVLLFRRDNKLTIPYPNQLDILGGLVEEGETPEQAIVREMGEELDDLRTGVPYILKAFRLFKVYKDARGVQQHVFCKEADFDIEDVRLNEGQELCWFAPMDLEIPLAFGFNSVVREFFEQF